MTLMPLPATDDTEATRRAYRRHLPREGSPPMAPKRSPVIVSRDLRCTYGTCGGTYQSSYADEGLSCNFCGRVPGETKEAT